MERGEGERDGGRKREREREKKKRIERETYRQTERKMNRERKKGKREGDRQSRGEESIFNIGYIYIYIKLAYILYEFAFCMSCSHYN